MRQSLYLNPENTQNTTQLNIDENTLIAAGYAVMIFAGGFLLAIESLKNAPNKPPLMISRDISRFLAPILATLANRFKLDQEAKSSQTLQRDESAQMRTLQLFCDLSGLHLDPMLNDLDLGSSLGLKRVRS